MQLIKPYIQIIDEPDIAKRIEIAARTCYKSEDKITDDSAMKMVKALIKRGHDSPLEHSNIIVLTRTDKATVHMRDILTAYECEFGIPHYIRNCGSSNERADYNDYVWSGNLRAWRNIVKRYRGEDIIQVLFSADPLFEDIFAKEHYLTYSADELIDCPESDAIRVDCDPENRDRHKILTARLVSDRGILAEITRHRLFGISAESTRYCRYNSDNGVTYIEPWWFETGNERDVTKFRHILEHNDHDYQVMNDFDYSSAQKSRAALNQATKSEVVLTGTLEYWKNIVIPLRSSPAAHPDMVRIIKMIEEEME